MDKSKTIVIILKDGSVNEYDNVTVSTNCGSSILGDFLYIVSNDVDYFIPFDTIDTLTLKII